LVNGCTLTAKNGIKVEGSDNSLTIYAQSLEDNTMGRLSASISNGYNAAIGSSGGVITINGGAIDAKGGSRSAGIGGGQNSTGGVITINGGKVIATGGDYSGAGGYLLEGGAGIGSGRKASGGIITINGGDVTATGSGGGAGIGGGGSGTGGTITITGGTVNATGSRGGAGIGDGNNSSGGTFSTGKSGNAFIIASSISGNTDTTGWRGVIFQGNNGQVYGSPVLGTDATIPGGKNLEIPADTTLAIGQGVTLTNKGEIINSGTIEIEGRLENKDTITCRGTIKGSLSSNKAIPVPETVPSPTAVYGQTLNDVPLPDGWRWEDSSTSVGEIGTNSFPAIYFKDNSGNYREVERNLDVQVGTVQISGALTITGEAIYGHTLTASYTPSNNETVSYQWKRGDADISGVSGSTYTLGTDDIGKTITVTATPTDTTNYTGSVTSNATATVAKATPTVQITVAMSGNAGAREAVLTVTVTGVTGGSAPTGTVTLTGNSGLNQKLMLTNDTASYPWSGLAEGEYTVTAEYNSDGNYNTASAEKTFNTSKQEQTALTIGSVGNKTYGDSEFILSASGGSGFGAVTFTSSDPSVININEATATIHKAGGPVTITATKAEDKDYNAATATLTITVAKKAVVFKANDKTVQQGGTMPTFDYAPVTLAQGDSITTQPTAACTATDTNTTGTFPITFSGAELTNGESYDISYVPGTLTITATTSGGNTGNSGGGSYTPPTTTYPPTVEKPSEGGGAPSTSPSNPKPGDAVTVKPKPDEGYEVDKITVTDKDGNPVEVTVKPDGTYTFKQPNGKVTIEVTYKPVDTPWNNPFADVSEGDWYYEAVRFVHERGLMNGYSDGRFGPNDTLSRAQLAQILFNKEGRPGVDYLPDFSDVAGEAWYTEAIRWATSQGIVGGYGNGTFGPNDPITREQLAVMLWRYSGSPAATNKELHFNDTDEISGFALEALRWAVENGILNGYGGGRLGPQGQATRAQVAQMLKNFIENQEEENT